MSNIRKELRDKILNDMILPVVTKKDKKTRHCILIVDPHTTSIISSCMRMFDIMENGILTVENIELQREKIPSYSAIYFLRPTKENVELIVNDFKDKPSYKSIYLYFTAHFKTEWLSLLSSNAKVMKYIKSFIELNIDYLTIESNIFSLEYTTNCLNKLYFPTKNKDILTKELRTIARKLASFYLCSGEIPYIRYDNTSKRSLLCKALAKLVSDYLHKHIKKLNNSNNKFKYNTDRPKGTLLILERSLDVLSPLLHEFTYQAMVEDLCTIHGEIVTINQQNYVVSEDDILWNELRHKHMAIVNSTISNKFKEFMGKSATSSFQKSKKNKSELSLKEMTKVMKEYPQYRAMMQGYEKHFAIASECAKKGTTKEYIELGTFEQDLATGISHIDDTTCKKKN